MQIPHELAPHLVPGWPVDHPADCDGSVTVPDAGFGGQDMTYNCPHPAHNGPDSPPQPPPDPWPPLRPTNPQPPVQVPPPPRARWGAPHWILTALGWGIIGGELVAKGWVPR